MKNLLPALLKSSLLLGIFFFQKNIFAQYDDAQLWQNLYFERNLKQKLVIHVNEEGRVTDNWTRPSYIYTDWGITYKASKHWHFTLAYVPILKRQYNDYISLRHQYYFDIVFKQKIKHFTIYDRQIFQNQYNDINRTPNWKIPSYYLRNKVTVKYTLKHTPFILYAAEEYYYQISNTQLNGYESDRMRFYLGIFFEKDLVNEFELYYLIEPHYHIYQPFTNWIVGVGYAHKLYW